MSTQSLTAVQSGAYTYFVDESTGKAYKVDNDADISVFGASKGLSVGDDAEFGSTSADYVCTDGKDDGKISAGEACVSAFKGIAKMVVSPITEACKGNFVPAAVAAAGAVAIGLLGPVGIIGASVVGLVGGGTQLYKGISNAQNAKTDGEAKMAFEEIGQGGFATATSLLGLKGGMKQLKTMKRSGNLAEAKNGNFIDKTRAYFKDLKTNKAAARAKKAEADELKASKKAEKELWRERKKAGDQLKQKEIDKLVKQVQREEAASAANNTPVTSSAGQPALNAEAQNQINNASVTGPEPVTQGAPAAQPSAPALGTVNPSAAQPAITIEEAIAALENRGVNLTYTDMCDATEIMRLYNSLINA